MTNVRDVPGYHGHGETLKDGYIREPDRNVGYGTRSFTYYELLPNEVVDSYFWDVPRDIAMSMGYLSGNGDRNHYNDKKTASYPKAPWLYLTVRLTRLDGSESQEIDFRFKTPRKGTIHIEEDCSHSVRMTAEVFGIERDWREYIDTWHDFYTFLGCYNPERAQRTELWARKVQAETPDYMFRVYTLNTAQKDESVSLRAADCEVWPAPSRPCLDDEAARVNWWRKSLSRNTSADVIVEEATQCLALRDREIAALKNQIKDLVGG